MTNEQSPEIDPIAIIVLFFLFVTMLLYAIKTIIL